MLILICPNCGPRNISEFKFGGERGTRPAPLAAQSDAQWADYLYMRTNRSGVQVEWWYHASGCGLWFFAERDTRTNKILRTFRYEPAAADSAAG